jgi:hypothetical protein
VQATNAIVPVMGNIVYNTSDFIDRVRSVDGSISADKIHIELAKYGVNVNDSVRIFKHV